jgi:hypothetical protein
MNNISNSKNPVILFIPEAGIYPFMRGLAVLGDAVVKQGGNVFVTHDTGQMLRSPIMAMHKTSINVTPKERDRITSSTEKCVKSVIKNYKFSTIELCDFTNNQLMKEINSLGIGANNDLKKITFRGFPVGKIAEYDFILETKFPYSSKLNTFQKNLYLQYVRNTALSLAITDSICKYYKPSLILTFNEYAQCQAVKYSAKNNNVSYKSLTYPVHFNIDASKFSIWNSTYQNWRYNHSQQWGKWSKYPIRKQDVFSCWEDCIFRMYNSGSHIFSRRKNNNLTNTIRKLKLNLNQKTIVAYTSSQDERATGEISMKIWNEKNPIVEAFNDQIKWLLTLRDYASKRNDVQIIVRIHPREGSNNLGIRSQYLLRLKKIFKKDSSNFKILWPNNSISSYDLLELADVCLIAWSNMGQEAARLGIPVLSYSGNGHYPNDDFIQIATTKKEYIKKLDSILKMKFSWQQLTKAIRFYHWRTFIPALNLSDTVPRDYENTNIWPVAPKSKVKAINEVLSGKRDLIKENINEWQKSLPKNAIDQEKKAMRRGIRYLIEKMFYPPPAKNNLSIVHLLCQHIWHIVSGKNLFITHPPKQYKDYILKYTENILNINSWIKRTRNNANISVIVADYPKVILIRNGEILHRTSPLIMRLAKLYASND